LTTGAVGNPSHGSAEDSGKARRDYVGYVEDAEVLYLIDRQTVGECEVRHD